MSEPATTIVVKEKAGCFSIKGCFLMISLFIGTIVLGVGYFKVKGWWADREAKKAREAEAKVFDEVVESWSDSVAQKLAVKPGETPVPYDIDKTVRVMHQIDQAVREKENFEEFLTYAGQLDTRGVDPEILKARGEILMKLRELYVLNRELEESQALWAWTSDIFLGVIDTFNVELSPSGLGFDLDRDKAKENVTNLRDRKEKQTELRAEILKQKEALFGIMFAYSEIYYERLEEWDRLCLLRDRAYLAAADGQWSLAEQNARAAISRAPHELEAHLLLAQALVEQGGEQQVTEAHDLLTDYIVDNPGRTAPALLLLGVLEMRQGKPDEARLNLQNAASQYPRQAATLTDMLDPYKMRSYLRQSREGNVILRDYQSLSLGAGYFSPELQLAQLNYGQRESATAQADIFTHFARRRLQGQWDFVLEDMAFCNEYLGTDFERTFPEAPYLELEVKHGYGDKVTYIIHNRTGRDLHNASVVLCIAFTDMLPGDYVALPAGDTVAVIRAGESMTVGSGSVGYEFNRVQKGADDMVEVRAILISEDGITWVDTPEGRRRQAQQDARPTGTEGAVDADWAALMRTSPEQVIAQLRESVRAYPRSKFGKDAMDVVLPRELVLMRPVFRLHVDGMSYDPATNAIEAGQIKLSFTGLPEVGREEDLPVTLEILGQNLNMTLDLQRDGKQYIVGNVRSQ